MTRTSKGTILLQARIGIDGKVQEVEVISPVNADLEDEAIAAVSQWEFSPTYLNCEPIEVQMYRHRVVQDRAVMRDVAPRLRRAERRSRDVGAWVMRCRLRLHLRAAIVLIQDKQ